MGVFFTSDLHFGHARVIEYSKRPFSSADEMDEALVQRWNELVTDRDVVNVLGDVALCKLERAVALLHRLRGTKVLFAGNHDRKLRDHAEFRSCFASVHDLGTVDIPDADAPGGWRHVVACHFAMRTWDRSHYGSWHVHGHSHGGLGEERGYASLDVGVDCWDYRPVSYEQVKAKMLEKLAREEAQKRQTDIWRSPEFGRLMELRRAELAAEEEGLVLPPEHHEQVRDAKVAYEMLRQRLAQQ